MKRYSTRFFKRNCKSIFLFFIFYFFALSIYSQQKKYDIKFIDALQNSQSNPNEKGKIVRPLSCGRAAFFKNDKWGFANAKGAEVIKAQYDWIYDFKTDATAVMKNGHWNLVDTNGLILNKSPFDLIGAFENGKAKVVNRNKFNYIDHKGKLLSDNWTLLKNNFARSDNNNVSNVNVGCPANFDFDFGDFTHWICDTGQVVGPAPNPVTNPVVYTPWGYSTNGQNQIINSTVTLPLPDRHQIIINNIANAPDIFGGFSINPPDGSNSCIKLGSYLNDGGFDPLLSQPWPGAKSESVSYDLFIPSNTINLSFIYNYAVVLDEPIPVASGVDANGQTIYSPPIHLFDDKPRFKVEIFDLATNQIVRCGKLEYVADPSSAGAGGFLQSPLSNSQNTLWYKPWSKRFINLAPFAGKNIRIKFTTTDCTLGGHWGYAYLDIEGCVNVVKAIRTCSIPVKTVMDGPTGFQNYEWYNSNFSTHLGSGIHLVSTNSIINVGDTINLISTPSPLPFISDVCPDTIKVIVQGPSISFEAGPNKTFCEGNSSIIGSGPINNGIYLWTPSIGLSNTSSSQVVSSPTTTTTYYITVTDTTTSCSTTDSVKVIVKPTPHVVINASATCHNQSSTIIVSGGDAYNWTPQATLNNVSPGNPSICTITAPDSGATYHVSVSLNSSGCIVDTSITVAAHPIPIVDFFLPQPMCLRGNQFYFTSGSFVFPGTISSNIWIVNGGAPILGPEASATFSTIGLYPVQLISYSDFGCVDSVTRYIEVLPMPTASFSVPSAQCQSFNSFQFSNLSTTTTGNISTFLWDFGDNHYASDTPAVHHYINPGNYTIQLIVIANNGCQDTTTRNVRVFSMPIADFAQPDSQCLRGNRFIFTSQSSTTSPSTVTSNLWYIGGNPMPISGNTITHSFAGPGTYPIKLVTTSSDGCKDSINQVLMVYPQPVANFNLPSTICFLNNNFLFTSSSTVSSGFIDSCFWDFGDGLTSIGNPIRHPYNNPNVLQYQIRLISLTNHGCRDTTSNSFSFLPSPQVSILPVASLSMCSGDSITLNATAQTPSGSITSYQWSVGGAIIAGAITPSITVHTSGVYQIHVTNTVSCWATSGNDTVIVHPLPEGNVVLPNTDFICENGNKLLVCNANATSYQWYMNGNIITGATSSSYLATLPGIYSVQLFSSFGCHNFANGSILLSIRKKPVVDFSYPTFCKNAPINFNNNSDTSECGHINWIWDFGDGTSSIESNPIHIFLNSGPDTVKLTAIPSDCPSFITDSQLIIIVADTLPGIRYTSMNTTKHLSINLQSRDFNSNVLWMPSSGLNNPNITTPVFNYDRDVEFLIRVRNVSGCPTFDTLLVRVFDIADIRVPTAFSPNGDGHNDYLDYFLIGIDKFKRFMVFNRWGQILFETTDPKQRWDGTFKGKKQPLETYVWLAEGDDSNGITIFRRGQTILLR